MDKSTSEPVKNQFCEGSNKQDPRTRRSSSKKATNRLGQSQLLWIMDNLWFYIQLLWMVDDLQFTSFLTEFQSYQIDRRMIIKGLYNWIPFTVERFRSLMGFEPKTATIRGPAPNLPCKIIASHKTLTYQIKKKYLFKERKLFFSNWRGWMHTD